MAKPYFPVGFLKYSHKFTQAGDPTPYYVTGAASLDEVAATPSAIATSFHAAAATFHQARMTSNVILKETIVRISQGPNADDFTGQALGDTAGGSASSPLPQNCAFLVQKFTGLAGRHNQGRMYWPTPAEGEVNAIGEILPTVIGGFNTALLNYLNGINNTTGVGEMVLLHVPRPGVLEPVPTIVNLLLVDPIIATQRGRMR
jgi:hypothetical protein